MTKKCQVIGKKNWKGLTKLHEMNRNIIFLLLHPEQKPRNNL